MGLFSKSGNGRLRIFRGASNSIPEPVDDRPRVLFVSHEATRTGAPMIILNILKHFQRICDVQCDTILHSGGHLATEFQKYSEVDCLNVPRKACDDVKKKVNKFVTRHKGTRPVIAICNSMESRHVAEEVAALGIPIVYLVHELPSSYTEEDYQNVYAYSNKVIFPVQAVREAAEKKTPIPTGKAVVLPQGLLNPSFASKVSRAESRKKIIAELSLPEDSYIVLGCGTLDLRKGIDHFANVAREVVNNGHNNRPVHFVWVGEGHRWTHSPYHYVQIDLEKSGCFHNVHFIGERPDVEHYFVGADTFLMSSRVDPFPCVIHEAMAAGLPIITFENSGGAVEAIAGGAGIAVPYADYTEAANVIRMLINQPELASGIRTRSKERVHSRYRFDDYVEKIVDLAESTCGRHLRKAITAEEIKRAA